MLEAQASISRSRQLVKISIVLTAALVVAALFAIWALRQEAIQDTEGDNHRLGVVLAEQTTRTIQAVDLVLREVSDRIANAGIDNNAALHGAFGDFDVRDALTKRLIDLPQAGAFMILDAKGHFVNTTRQWPAPEMSLSDRNYFLHFSSMPDSGPYLSEPIPSRVDGLVTIILARRLTARDGSFLGVIGAAIQLDYFDKFFAEIGLSDGTGITILRNDGVFLVRFPAARDLFATRMPADSPWPQTVRAGGGHFVSPGVLDSQGARYVSVHPLTAYPIVVDVTRQASAALEQWRRQALAIGVGVGGAMLGFALLLLALRRQITIIECAGQRIDEQVDAVREGQAHLAVQSGLLETTLEHMNHGLMMVDAFGVVAICNRRAIEMLELPSAMMAARPRVTDVVEYQKQSGEFAGSHDAQPDSAAMNEQHAMYERRRPNGTILEIRSTALPGGGMVRTFADVTARSVAEEMLGLAASHDQLTGLLNRNGFGTKRDALLAAARRDRIEVAVLCLDLDRFKTVNDTLGHDAGDQLLRLVSERMREVTRAHDVVARLGGDEFAIILPNSNLAKAERVCQRLLDSIRLPYQIGATVVRIGVSIGVTTYPGDGNTADQLMRNADTALYKAKTEGRDTWRAYASADGARQHERMTLELDFRTAMATGQFVMAYQPICDAVTSMPVGFEALVRWNHPTRGVVSPGEFIPIAEQTGLIVPLGRWIIETACAEAATWAIPLRIAVNLSPAQFRERDLVAFISDVLVRTRLSPDRLDLEVTEGLLLDDADDVVTTMNALSAMGIRMVLDDFGTAHSNLSYLRGFPFEVVKIDQSFMRALNTDRQARTLVEAILAMARALGLEVIGEGVETQEQLALLRHLQCRLVQGYLLGRPAPAVETRDLIWDLAASQAGNVRPDQCLLPASA